MESAYCAAATSLLPPSLVSNSSMRAVQKYVQDPLAEKILQGNFPDGSTVKVLAGSDRLNFKLRGGAAKAAA